MQLRAAQKDLGDAQKRVEELSAALAQALLDDEAFRRLDVLEVDAAEGRPEEAHAIDELVDVLGADLDVHAIDVGEALDLALEVDLHAELERLGYQFTSETDTEVIAHRIHHHLGTSKDLFTAVQKTVAELRGAYSLAFAGKGSVSLKEALDRLKKER